MKRVVSEELVDRIRSVIEETRKALQENKEYRLKLYHQIASVKTEIRKLEQLASAMQIAKNDTLVSFVRSEIKKKQENLHNMRQEVISAEIFRRLEKAKFRVLHAQLDEFNLPFDPKAKKRAR